MPRSTTLAPAYPICDDGVQPLHGYDLGDGLRFSAINAGEPASPLAFRTAFDFLQMHAEGRYSDRTLMAISRWSQRSHDHILDDRYPENPARMFSISREVGYDENTEVKSGGTIALAVTLPNEQGTNKLVMAVSRDARREGYGRRLLERVSDYAHGVHAWVGNRNVCGQQFLLNVGMFPVSMNARQAVLYAFANLPEDEGVAL